MSDAERMSLLEGDSTVPSGAEVEVPIMDNLCRFHGRLCPGCRSGVDLVHDSTQLRTARRPPVSGVSYSQKLADTMTIGASSETFGR
ncbi:hypothetical protein [Streptomyces sp. NPDC059215]|uniref:hypothetical protein n=1 Tax=Streptomyces sp. NPDC059215 TaxID=3346772 RepID=UPI0036AFF67B